jgi:hypothetical protein
MIVTAAMPMAQRAGNSERIMSENLKRLPPNSSTEFEGEETSGLSTQKVHHMEEIMQLFDLITNETTVFHDKVHACRKIGKHLKSLRDMDPEW